jgi:hypothetical protein
MVPFLQFGLLTWLTIEFNPLVLSMPFALILKRSLLSR